MNPVQISRIPTLKTIQAFRDYIARLGIDLQAEDEIVKGYEEFRTFWGEMNFRRVEWK